MASQSREIQLMVKERTKIAFNVEEMTNILDGGPEKTETRRKTTEKIQSDPISGDLDWFYKSKEEIFMNGLKRAVRIKNMGLDESDDTVRRTIPVATLNAPGLSLHKVAFLPPLKMMGSKEQVEKWVPLASDYKIIGCYAQTELGHGSNLKRLETTATFIPETQEFEINSPSLTSMKWWPGDMAKCANHVIVMANLTSGDQEYGMHPFIVQIRDLDTHEPLPGITVGDIGYTFANAPSDHGFLLMDHIRIPRENMLAGIAEIDSSGHYNLKSDPKLIYGSMMLLRVRLIDTTVIFPLQAACTIATRYSLMRRQGNIDPEGPEVSVLDYVTQQRKLLPLIAQAYAFHLSAQQIRYYHAEVMQGIQKSDFSSNLSELHALTAGMKAFVTDQCVAGADICRRSCGGHGYLMASGFPRIMLYLLASVTYEGENTVMYLQCARYLVKCTSAALSGKVVKGFADYLNDNLAGRCQAVGIKSFRNHDILLQCFRHRANRTIKAAYHKLESLKRSGKSHNEAWNLTSVDLVEMSKTHLGVYVLSTFMRVIREQRGISDQSRMVLENLCSLYGMHVLNNDIGSLLMDGYFNAQQASDLMEAELSLLSVVREYALGLVDAFDFTDKTLQSCLGSYDGNVYERLYENAKRSPRNQTEVHEEFYKIFKDSLHRGRDVLQGPKSKL